MSQRPRPQRRRSLAPQRPPARPEIGVGRHGGGADQSGAAQIPRPAPRSATRRARWCRSARSPPFGQAADGRQRQPSTAPRLRDDLVRSRARHGAFRRAQAAIDAAEAQIAHADHVHGTLRRRRRLTSQQQQGSAAAADPRGAGDDLHRARHPLRKPRPPADRAVDAAGRRRGRGAGADDVRDGFLDHRADRRVPAARHRQEERDPDHRLRDRTRSARAGSAPKPRRARRACCASARS